MANLNCPIRSPSYLPASFESSGCRITRWTARPRPLVSQRLVALSESSQRHADFQERRTPPQLNLRSLRPLSSVKADAGQVAHGWARLAQAGCVLVAIRGTAIGRASSSRGYTPKDTPSTRERRLDNIPRELRRYLAHGLVEVKMCREPVVLFGSIDAINHVTSAVHF